MLSAAQDVISCGGVVSFIHQKKSPTYITYEIGKASQGREKD